VLAATQITPVRLTFAGRRLAGAEGSAIRGARRLGGFTLLEACITLLVMSLLAGFAVSSYNSYIHRARAGDAVEELDHYRTRMEKAFQDNGNYGVGACAVVLPSTVVQFTFTCQLGQNGQAFTARATGTAGMSGYAYSIDQQGLRRTVTLPGLVAATDCWMVQPGKCQ
jgi:type IV pilus assembly protein PilE